MRIIKVHSLPITTKKVEEKIDLKPIPAPVPEETFMTESLTVYYIDKEDLLSDDLFYIEEDEFKPPDYDDILIGVLGRTAKEGQCVYSPEIIYPEEDIKAYIQGKIVLKLTVNKKGKVVSAFVLKGVGNTRIEKAAKEAALKRLYKPVTSKGKPIFFHDKWTIDFDIK